MAGTLTKARQNAPRKQEGVKALYVRLTPTTFRYQRLLELAKEYDCSYHRIALDAIDWYLRTQTRNKT